MSSTTELETKIESLHSQLVDLQIQFTFQERNIRQLDEVIQEQYREIDTLKSVQKKLLAQLDGLDQAQSAGTQYESPPHY